jgi:hypothetical protein
MYVRLIAEKEQEFSLYNQVSLDHDNNTNSNNKQHPKKDTPRGGRYGGKHIEAGGAGGGGVLPSNSDPTKKDDEAKGANNPKRTNTPKGTEPKDRCYRCGRDRHKTEQCEAVPFAWTSRQRAWFNVKEPGTPYAQSKIGQKLFAAKKLKHIPGDTQLEGLPLPK